MVEHPDLFHRLSRKIWDLKPLLPTEENKHPDAEQNGDAPEGQIAVAPVELRHIPRSRGVKVHAVNPSKEGERHEEGRDQREHPHDLVGAEAEAGVVDVHESRREISEALGNIDHLGEVVIAVPEINNC